MKRIKSVNLITGIMLLACFGLTGQTFSQTTVQKPVKLEYNIPSEGVKYLTTSKIIQTMDIMGQSMQANVSSSLGCSIRSTGKTGSNMNLEVKIDTLGQLTDSPNGVSGGAAKEVIGKTFNMVLAPSGKEIDIAEAKKISYNIDGSGPGDMSESFYDYFPDLPEKSVSPGYTWTTTDTMNAKTQTMSVFMIIKSENIFEGFETSDGVTCARIASVLSGTREVKTSAQGMDFKITGPFTGSGILLFAPSKGYFLKQDITTKMNGTMEMSAPETMTFPMVMDMSSVNEVVK